MKSLDPVADIVVTSIMMDMPMNMSCNDLTLDQAFDVQDLVADRLLAPRGGLAGYKIAWNTEAQITAMGLPHPGAGRVFKSDIRKAGAHIKLADFSNLMIEVEIVAYLGADVEPGQTYTQDNIAPYIRAFGAGFEILDRLKGAEGANAKAMIAHNVFNAGAVLGDTLIPVEDVDPDKLTTRFFINDEIALEERGRAPQPPLEAAAFLANHFSARGMTLHAGKVILCGSHIPLHPINKPGSYALSMGALGEVTFNVV